MNNKAHPFYFEQSQFYWVPAGFCWRRKWQPTPVFLPGVSQGQRSLVGCRLWDNTELDTTKSNLAAAGFCGKEKELR